MALLKTAMITDLDAEHAHQISKLATAQQENKLLYFITWLTILCISESLYSL